MRWWSGLEIVPGLIPRFSVPGEFGGRLIEGVYGLLLAGQSTLDALEILCFKARDAICIRVVKISFGRLDLPEDTLDLVRGVVTGSLRAFLRGRACGPLPRGPGSFRHDAYAQQLQPVSCLRESVY